MDGLSSLASVGDYIKVSSNAALTSIEGFVSLESIGGYLVISHNKALTSISGLASLKAVRGLDIQSNAELITLSGLSSLESVAGDAYIRDNTALVTVDGLSSLVTVGSHLLIRGNSALTDIRGLSALTSAEALSVRDNDVLTNVDGLSSLVSVGQDLWISENALLRDVDSLSQLASIGRHLVITANPTLTRCCNLFSLLDAGGIGGMIILNNNGAGCTESEVLNRSACPSFAINALIGDVAALVYSGALKKGHGHALTNRLDSALKELDRDDIATAIKKLQKFIDQLVELVVNGEIDGNVAGGLINDTAAIIGSMTSPSPSPGKLDPPDGSTEKGPRVPLQTGFVGIRPNPFNPSTTLSFDLATAGMVQLNVYDARGLLIRRLRDETLPVGRYQVTWDGKDEQGRTVSTGIYFVRLMTAESRETRKAILMK
jgi:hypothetical protein